MRGELTLATHETRFLCCSLLHMVSLRSKQSPLTRQYFFPNDLTLWSSYYEWITTFPHRELFLPFTLPSDQKVTSDDQNFQDSQLLLACTNKWRRKLKRRIARSFFTSPDSSTTFILSPPTHRFHPAIINSAYIPIARHNGAMPYSTCVQDERQSRPIEPPSDLPRRDHLPSGSRRQEGPIYQPPKAFAHQMEISFFVRALTAGFLSVWFDIQHRCSRVTSEPNSTT